MASIEHGSLGTSQTASETGGGDPFDEAIKVIADSSIIFLPNPEAVKALLNPDTRVVAELVAGLVHPSTGLVDPSNETLETYIEDKQIPIPPAWNHPDQERSYSHGRLGTIAMQRFGEYQRDGKTRRGAVTWYTVFVAPGNPPEKEIFKQTNVTFSELKLTEFAADGQLTSIVLPMEGSRLDVVGVSQMPQLVIAGGMARGLMEAGIVRPNQTRSQSRRTA